MIGKFKAAAVQTAPVFLNKRETIGKVCGLIEEAGESGAKLIVFPEALIPTYPYWPKDAGAGAERKLIMDTYTELYKNSIEIPGADTDKIAAAAKSARSYVVIGVNERAGGTLYNTMLFFDDKGGVLGKRRKLMGIHSEKCIWGMGGAQDLPVFDTDIGKIGGLFCYEHHMTLAKYALFTKGEQIHVGLWAGHGFVKPTMDFASRQYAFEGQVFVITASLYVNSDMIPDSFPLKKTTEWDFPGGSAIINPRGECIAGPIYDREGIIYADIDPDMIIRAKGVIDGVGHFSRPDILRLNLCSSADGSSQVEELTRAIEDLQERQSELESKLERALKSRQ
ncbi:MAG: carbon-nitrogen hydrolase family protein [Deltaproteobacteria bacterium]